MTESRNECMKKQIEKPPFILPNFPVLDISEGEVELIKRAETFEDIFHTYNI